MSILASKLHELASRVDAADGVDASFASDVRDVCDLAAGLDLYLSRWTTPESAALASLALNTAAEDWGRRRTDGAAGQLEQEMLSGHVEGQFLKMLVHATRAERVLDIGMFTGYSALAMAEAVPADGVVIACEIDADVAAFAAQCFRESLCGSKIAVKVGPALHTLHELSGTGEPFDLIFIDADKGGYVDYVTTIVDADLLAPHGLICVDNTLMQGQPWLTGPSTANGTAIADFNRTVAADPRLEQVIVPLRDGLTLIRRIDGG